MFATLWFVSYQNANVCRLIVHGHICLFQHFVSERKYDEDLGKAVKFTFELEPLKLSITEFGSGTTFSNFGEVLCT